MEHRYRRFIQQRTDEGREDEIQRAREYEYCLAPFSEVIPGFWREEILEPPDTPLK
jgi:hypothetical protein